MLHSFTFCSDTYTECQNTMKLYLQHDVKSLSTSQWYMCLNQSRMWQNYKIKQEAWDFMCIWAEVTASYIYNDASSRSTQSQWVKHMIQLCIMLKDNITLIAQLL